MLPELAAIVRRVGREFRIKDAAARDKKWMTLRTVEEKVSFDPELFLREQFPVGSTGEDTIIIKFNYPGGLRHVASCLNLCCLSTNAPKAARVAHYIHEQWTVIGREWPEVTSKIRQIEREAARAEEALKEAEAEELNEAHAAIISRLKRGADWNVTGTWRIKYPEIDNGWDTTQLSLDIHHDGRQMSGEFNWGILEGVMRFQNPGASKSRVVSKSKSTTADKSETEEEGDDEENEDEDDEEDDNLEDETDEVSGEGDPKQLPKPNITPNSIPSPQHPTWTFRWRGRETGQGEIQLGSDQNLCSMTFRGPGGCKLNSIFYCDFIGECAFTGLKIGDGSKLQRVDIDGRWMEFSE